MNPHLTVDRFTISIIEMKLKQKLPHSVRKQIRNRILHAR